MFADCCAPQNGFSHLYLVVVSLFLGGVSCCQGVFWLQVNPWNSGHQHAVSDLQCRTIEVEDVYSGSIFGGMMIDAPPEK